MTTFNGDKEYKNKLVEQMKLHREQDKIIQGKYITFDNETLRGCFIGCVILSHEIISSTKLGGAFYDDIQERKTSYRVMAEQRTGIPESFYDISEHIFESLHPKQAPDFAVNLMEAIPTGLTETDLIELFKIDYSKSFYQWLSREGEVFDEEWNEFVSTEKLYEHLAKRLIETLTGI